MDANVDDFVLSTKISVSCLCFIVVNLKTNRVLRTHNLVVFRVQSVLVLCLPISFFVYMAFIGTLLVHLLVVIQIHDNNYVFRITNINATHNHPYPLSPYGFRVIICRLECTANLVIYCFVFNQNENLSTERVSSSVVQRVFVRRVCEYSTRHLYRKKTLHRPFGEFLMHFLLIQYILRIRDN